MTMVASVLRLLSSVLLLFNHEYTSKNTLPR